jgi:putative transposase
MRTNNNVAFDCKYHVVWCSKYRRAVLEKGADKRLKELLRDVAAERQAIILEVEVMKDHGGASRLKPPALAVGSDHR